MVRPNINCIFYDVHIYAWNYKIYRINIMKDVSIEKREQIINYFYSHHDNTDQAIAKVFNLPRKFVSQLIARHLKCKMDRINKRK